MIGIAVGVALPLTVTGHDWGLASALIGAIALIVLGLRVLFGSKFGGEVVLILTMIAGFAAVAAAIIGATRSSKSAGSTTRRTSRQGQRRRTD